MLLSTKADHTPKRSWTVQVPISRLFGMWVLDRRVLGSRRIGRAHVQHFTGRAQTVPRLLQDDGRRVRRRNTNGPQVASASPNAGELWLEQIGLRPIRPRALAVSLLLRGIHLESVSMGERCGSLRGFFGSLSLPRRVGLWPPRNRPIAPAKAVRGPASDRRVPVPTTFLSVSR